MLSPYCFKRRVILVVSMSISVMLGMAMIAPSTNAQQNIGEVVTYLTHPMRYYEFRIDTGRGTPEYAMKVIDISDRTSTSFHFRGVYYRGGYGVFPPKEPNVSGIVTVVGTGPGMRTTIRFTTDGTVGPAVTSFEGAIRFMLSSRFGPSSAFMAGTYSVGKDSNSTSLIGPFPFVASGLGRDDAWLP